MNESAVGSSYGWNTFKPSMGKMWTWSAYGPHGGTQGVAFTEEDAIRRAKAEAEWLKRGWKAQS